jgi:hypothetical protein
MLVQAGVQQAVESKSLTMTEPSAEKAQNAQPS